MLNIEVNKECAAVDMRGDTKELTADAGCAVMAVLDTMLSLGLTRAQSLKVLTMALKEVYK